VAIVRIVMANKRVIIRKVFANNRCDYEDSVGS
jgi:hypothetical protein